VQRTSKVRCTWYIYFAVARYQPDGNLDLTFGDEGKAITNMGEYDYPGSLAVQEDGKLVVAGSVKFEQGTRDFILVRYK
jgi:hypothetical protein